MITVWRQSGECSWSIEFFYANASILSSNVGAFDLCPTSDRFLVVGGFCSGYSHFLHEYVCSVSILLTTSSLVLDVNKYY